MTGTIVRIERHERDFTILGNAFLQDNRLSFRATGLLAYLLSLPADWTIRVEHLARTRPEGKYKLRGAFLELQHCGYAVLEVVRGKKGVFGRQWRVFEVPKADQSAKAAGKIRGAPEELVFRTSGILNFGKTAQLQKPQTQQINKTQKRDDDCASLPKISALNWGAKAARKNFLALTSHFGIDAEQASELWLYLRRESWPVDKPINFLRACAERGPRHKSKTNSRQGKVRHDDEWQRIMDSQPSTFIDAEPRQHK
jgi:hypothetical protein